MIKKKQLGTGLKSYSGNIQILLGPVESVKRHKAILTLAKRKGLTYEQAQQYQAQRIAESRAAKM